MDKKIYDDLLNNDIKSYCIDEEGSELNIDLKNSLILSGSFNPLHKGHIKLLKVSMNEYQFKPIYEISISNVDKSKIEFKDLLIRINQFKSLGKLVITNSANFREKSFIFKKSIFVIGYDTALRLIEKKYYKNDIEMAFTDIKKNGCSFLVAGRFINNKYNNASTIDFNEFKKFFYILAEEKFRLDISSSQLRSQFSSENDKSAA